MDKKYSLIESLDISEEEKKMLHETHINTWWNPITEAGLLEVLEVIRGLDEKYN